MHLVPGRHFPNVFVATQRLKRNLGLEIRREPAPFRHLVFRRYPVEYTLARIRHEKVPPSSNLRYNTVA